MVITNYHKCFFLTIYKLENKLAYCEYIEYICYDRCNYNATMFVKLQPNKDLLTYYDLAP